MTKGQCFQKKSETLQIKKTESVEKVRETNNKENEKNQK